MTLRGTPFSCRVGSCSSRVGPCGSRVGPYSGRAGPCSCRVDSCLSGALPCGSGAVLGHPCGCRVDSVSIPEATVFVREHTVLAPAWWSLADLRCWKAQKWAWIIPDHGLGLSVLIWDCSLKDHQGITPYFLPGQTRTTTDLHGGYTVHTPDHPGCDPCWSGTHLGLGLMISFI